MVELCSKFILKRVLWIPTSRICSPVARGPSKVTAREKNSRIEELEKLNAKLEEEKKATFEIIEGEKARLLEEFKERKDRAVDMAMYRIWASNADLDTSFLGSFEDEFLAKWQARLEAEEAAREDAEKAKEDAKKAKEGAKKAKEGAPAS